jgi:alpha-amylase
MDLMHLINFDFKYDATKPATEFFAKYDQLLNGPLKGKSVMNYVSSHDDGSPFDKLRTKTYESATKLLLAPGIAQIYYGDETGRRLDVQAQGDATLQILYELGRHRVHPKPKTCWYTGKNSVLSEGSTLP